VAGWRRTLLFGTLGALVLIAAGARQQRVVDAARREADARRAAARLRALEDAALFRPNDSAALAALAQSYDAMGRAADAAALWERAGDAAVGPAHAGWGPRRSSVGTGGASWGPGPGRGNRTDAPSPGRPLPALDQLLERARRTPTDLALQQQAVELCQRLDRLPEAIPALERLARAHPADAVTWRRLGIAELQAERDGPARDHLRAAVARAPRDPVALFYLGLAHAGLAEVDAALTAFRRVQALRPDYTPAALERVRLQIEDWRLREAAAEARQLVRRRPRLADAQYQLGVALYHLHDLPAAEEALRAATRLDPRPARYHGWLGLTLLEQGRLPDAASAFEAAVAQNPRYTNGYYQLGRVFLLQGRLDDAEQSLRRVLLLDPRYNEACFSLGQLLLRRGNAAQAGLLLARFQQLSAFEQRRHYLDRRAHAEPRRAVWRRRLGDLYAREGLLHDARLQYERAGELEQAGQIGRLPN
jgi:tetratricopeptide (TPR) repeat protein